MHAILFIYNVVYVTNILIVRLTTKYYENNDLFYQVRGSILINFFSIGKFVYILQLIALYDIDLNP